MKNKFLYLSCIGALSFAFAGCAPQLARTKYGSEEQHWKNYINKSYADWEPPPTPPPYKISATASNAGNKEFSTIETVPEPVVLNNEESSMNIVDAFQQKPNVSSGKLDAAKTYTVQKGDTLWSIAHKFYNSGKYWKKIQEANKSQLAKPDSLKAGMVLTIPAN